MIQSRPKSQIYYLERLFVVISLLLMLGALKGLFVDLSQIKGGTGYKTEGNLRSQIFFASIYLISSVAVLARFGLFQWLCLRNKALILLMSLTVISILWSIDPMISLRRATGFAGSTIFAIYLVTRFRPEELLVLLAWAMGLAAIMSLVLVFVFPSYGVHQGWPQKGLWHGVFDHKNTLGRTMTLGVIVFLLVALMRRHLRWLSWSGFILCAGMVIVSGSRTAWLVLAILLIFLWPLRQLRKSQVSLALRFVPVAIVFIGGGLSLLVLNYEEGLALLGRDITLSGRAKIWELAYEFGSRRPLLGYGYRVFWTEEGAGYLYGLLGWAGGFGHAHNSFLDLWLDLGFVGVGVFLITLIICTRRAISRLVSTRDALGLWYPLFLAYMILMGITGIAFWNQPSITWVLYTTSMFYLCLPQPKEPSLGATASRELSRVLVSRSRIAIVGGH